MLRFILGLRTWLVAGLTTALLIVLLSIHPYRHDVTAPLPRQSILDRPLVDAGNATLGFEKIYMINLKSRTDHRDAAALAASLTGLRIDFVEAATNVSLRTLPPGGAETVLRPPEIGNWRSHMNVARLMVEHNIQSALVLEDDADWDIRIKAQMQDLAKATQLLLQPLKGTKDAFLDTSHPGSTYEESSKYTDIFLGQAAVQKPTTSPYGNLGQWDLLWLGHCGCRFPRASDGDVPLGRAVILNDTTVPEVQHLDLQFGDQDLVIQYPSHTRVVSRARINTCTTGYALSLPGARRLLYELGIHKLAAQTDMDLRAFCDGSGKRDPHVCLTVQPELFQQHRAVGSTASSSDISDHAGHYNKQAYTKNIRWSTRLNLPVLVNGSTDFIDLFEDGGWPLELDT